MWGCGFIGAGYGYFGAGVYQSLYTVGARGAERSWEEGFPEDGGVSADPMAERGVGGMDGVGGWAKGWRVCSKSWL